MGRTAVFLLSILILLAVGIGVVTQDYMRERTEVVTVQKKFIDVSKEGSHYIVVSSGGVPFEIERPWWMFFELKYNADRVYASIQEGGTYRLHYVGWRVDWFYWYPIVFYSEEAGVK